MRNTGKGAKRICSQRSQHTPSDCVPKARAISPTDDKKRKEETKANIVNMYEQVPRVYNTDSPFLLLQVIRRGKKSKCREDIYTATSLCMERWRRD